MTCANETTNISGKTVCNATEYKKCKGEQCPFYITVDNAKASLDKSYARINTMSGIEQAGVSAKYYDGKMPWKV